MSIHRFWSAFVAGAILILAGCAEESLQGPRQPPSLGVVAQVQSGAQSDQQPLSIRIYPPDPWVGGWRGTLTGPNGTVLQQVFRVFQRIGTFRYFISTGNNQGCTFTVAANDMDFSGTCATNPNLQYGALILDKWY
jgi:hypothetical protein